jgi:hypothetical protein
LFALLPFVIAALCWLLACRGTENRVPPPGEGEEQALDAQLVRSASAYRRALEAREQDGTVPFLIDAVKRDGGLMRVRVNGGCSEKSFKVVWDGAIAESHPAQVRLVLTHAPAADDCPPAATFGLTFNLRKIVGEGARPEDYVFHLENGSLRQAATLKPDGTVSTRLGE